MAGQAVGIGHSGIGPDKAVVASQWDIQTFRQSDIRIVGLPSSATSLKWSLRHGFVDQIFKIKKSLWDEFCFRMYL